MRIHRLTVVVCLLAGAGTAVAQDPRQIGLLGGPSAATLSDTADSNSSVFTARAGFSAGLFTVTASRHHIAVESGLLFTMKGANATEDGTDLSFRANFLEFPLLLRVQGTKHGRTSAHVVAGPVVARRLSAKQTAKTSAGSITVDVKDESRAGAFGLAVGAGVDAGRLRLDARYNHGLSRLNTDTSDGLNIKSREFTVLAGIIF